MPGLGEFLKEQREAKGWSLREAADQLDISHSRLIEIERGRSYSTSNVTRPGRDLILKFASLYGLAPPLLLSLAGYDGTSELVLTPNESQALMLFRKIPPHHHSLALGMLNLMASEVQDEDRGD